MSAEVNGAASGTIEEKLPKGLYRVRLDDGDEVKAHVSASTRKTTVKVSPGDRVSIELSPFDPTRGRITARH